MTKEADSKAPSASSQPNWWRPAALFIIVATPAVASFLAIRVLGDFFYQPTGGVDRPIWIAQALGVALIVTITFQMLLRKAQKSQALGGLSSLLEVPTVGAIGVTSAIPASAPFIAAVTVAAVTSGATLPLEPPTSLAFEQPAEVVLGDSEIVGGELDVPINREVGGDKREVGGDNEPATATNAAESERSETEDQTSEDDEAGLSVSADERATTSPTNSSTTTAAPQNATTSQSGNGSSPSSPTPTTPGRPTPTSTAPGRPTPTTTAPGRTTPTTSAPGRPTPTTASPTIAAPTTAAPTIAAPTTAAPTTAAPTTTTTAAPTTTTTAAPPATPAALSGSGFVMLNPNQVASFEAGETEVDRGASVLVERGPITLSGNLEIARAGSNRSEVRRAPQVTIPAGTTVCSYYIHFDVTGGNRQIASVTFDGEILGHTNGSVGQLESTSEFELSGIDYAIDFEAANGRGDDLWINRNTANFNFKTTASERDSIRFFTTCG